MGGYTVAIMKDFILPEGTNLADYFQEAGFDFVMKKKGFLANNMYIKIDRISGTKDEQEMTVVFKKDRDSQTLLTQNYQFTPSLDDDAGNLFKQGYEYLKTLPEFEGAIDIED